MKNQMGIRSLTVASIVIGIVVAACGDPDAQDGLPAADQLEVVRPEVVQLVPADRLQEQFDATSTESARADFNRARGAESERAQAQADAFVAATPSARSQTAESARLQAVADTYSAQAEVVGYSDQAEAQRHARLAATADLHSHAAADTAAYAEAQDETEGPVVHGLTQRHYLP
jgi:hypothetical protein